MHPLKAILSKPERTVIGLKSGTSADGIDAALTRISGHGGGTRVELLGFRTYPFPEDVREKILEIAGGGAVTAGQLCRMKTLLGILYADACEGICREMHVPKDSVDLVGSHGQTIWHIPKEETYLNHPLTGTLQSGEDAGIAERMGCVTVSDFRVRDMAAGGQGAPLVPYTEWLLYRRADETVALQNIGGIGNVTILPAGCGLDAVTAFDTGPGNMVIAALVTAATGGRQTCDEGGRIALRGRVSGPLLAWMLDDPYLAEKPPKSTGRERYGLEYVRNLKKTADEMRVLSDDLIATATRFTAETIALGLKSFAPRMPDTLIVGGGGRWNDAMLRDIRSCLPDCRVRTNEDLGLNSDAKEAVAFAILANEAVFGMCGNVPSVTGAKHPVVMGKISL